MTYLICLCKLVIDNLTVNVFVGKSINN